MRAQEKEKERSGSTKPQQITRIPPYRPGDWVKIKDFAPGNLDSLSGRIRQVRSISCSITDPDTKPIVWLVHFGDGLCLEWHLVERKATEEEIQRLKQR